MPEPDDRDPQAVAPDRSGARPATTRIPRCTEAERGYAVSEVDELLAAVDAALHGTPAGTGTGERTVTVVSARVRSAVFDGARGGYRPEVVDLLLDAAEDALAAAEREHFLRARGPDAWHDRLHRLTLLLRSRLDRPRTQRFRHPSRPRARGYSAAHVDVLCERLGARLDGTADLAPDELRRAVFPAAHGERSYEEQQVDAFLDRAVELLLALR